MAGWYSSSLPCCFLPGLRVQQRRQVVVSRFDKAMSTIVLGVIAPVALFLTGWWGSLWALGDHPWIAPSALGGLLLGVLLDATVLRKRLGSLFVLPLPALFAVALVYSVLIYGVFMGFPVVNLLVGIAGGYAVGRRATLAGESPQQFRREARMFAAWATGVLFALCCATAWIALSEPTIADELQHMFGLPFTPTAATIHAFIVVGGLGLVAAEWGATVVTANWAASGRIWVHPRS